MPELPDVEVFRRYMNATSLHQKIDRVSVEDPSVLGDVPTRSLQMRLKGRELVSTMRHGKYLFAETDDDEWLVLHFGMTGFLKYYKDTEQAPEHVRMRIAFANGYHLAYDCQRKLGLIDLTKDVGSFIEDKELGSDPYREDFGYDAFRDLLKGRRGSIKSSLMNQQLIAGIGNVYSDEILFQSGIHPASQVTNLRDKQLETIFREMQKVLETAIREKVNPDDFPDSFLLGHREPGADCPKCGGSIEKKTIGGRSGYFCSKHQKLME